MAVEDWSRWGSLRLHPPATDEFPAGDGPYDGDGLSCGRQLAPADISVVPMHVGPCQTLLAASTP